MTVDHQQISFLRLPNNQKRKRLLFIRSGASSEHTAWFKVGAPRSWDLMICYHTPTGPIGEDFSDVSFVGCKSKFHAIHSISKYSNLFDGYEAFGFLDDDIHFAFEDVDRLFDLIDNLDLGLCQPALSHDSFLSWEITLRNPSFLARYTNFVEIMVPFFRRNAFEICLDSFSKSISGYGLDFLWPKLLANNGLISAIVDAIPVKHCRPIDSSGGVFYNHLKTLGVNPQEEFRAIIDSYGLTTQPEIVGGILIKSQNSFIRFNI